MLFNSLGFIVFLLIVLAFYYTPLLNWNNKKRMLLLASYIFYGLWNPPLVILLWLSTMVDWIAGNKLSREEDPRRRKMWLMFSMVVNLGFLFFFKYRDFMVDNFTAVVNSYGYGYQSQPMDILLPMGISFYTFQTMSYTIDMYKRDGEPAKTFLDFALYVTFFPQLVAGPIVRAKDLVSQFYEEKRATTNQFIWGLFLLSIGLFQKVVLADTLLADNSDAVFSAKSSLHFLDAWAGTLAFSGQIFFDFAGYSTCAIGLALMLGFFMTENFKYPYASLGFSDFWTRWHITLSSWLRDYVYIPMGGNRHGILKTYAFLMITMLVGGLWHGAAWTFIVWGGLHGAYLILERLQRRYLPFKITAKNGIFLALTTYGCVNFTWVFFRAKDFHSAWNMIKSMLFLNPGGEKVLGTFDIIKIFILIGIMLLCHWFMRNTSLKEVSLKLSPWVLGVVWAAMIFLIAIAQGSGEQFIYFQF